MYFTLIFLSGVSPNLPLKVNFPIQTTVKSNVLLLISFFKICRIFNILFIFFSKNEDNSSISRLDMAANNDGKFLVWLNFVERKGIVKEILH